MSSFNFLLGCLVGVAKQGGKLFLQPECFPMDEIAIRFLNVFSQISFLG